MKLNPIRNKFLFSFVDDISGKSFLNKTDSGIIIRDVNNDVKYPRWAVVKAVGPDINDFTVNDTVLLEPLMWTNKILLDNVEYWGSEDTKVLAIKI